MEPETKEDKLYQTTSKAGLINLCKARANKIKQLEAERSEVKQQEIINNNIIEQLQIRVEQDIAKIKKLEDDAHEYSAWQSEYRASRAEVERLKAERSELRNKVIVAMEELKRMKMMKDDIENEIEQLRIIDDLLNSLKTK